MSSVFWMLKGKKSPAFRLVQNGFDVWLANARGNDFSMKHVNMSASDPRFWDFSFHEMAVYDVPAAIDYIRKKTGQRYKITYIGHSMGTTISYIYSSIHAKHAKNNVNMLISIAPVAFLGHIKTWISLGSPLYNLLQRETMNLGLHGTGQYPQIRNLLKEFCFTPPYMNICQRLVQSVVGTSTEQIEPEVMPLFYRRYPASFSIKTLLHFMQEVTNGGRFQWYDYGPRGNLIRYRSDVPPEYDIEKIQVPVYLIYGEQDLLSVENDVFKLFIKLKSPKYLRLFQGENNNVVFNHNDFLFSRHIDEFNKFLYKIVSNATSLSSENSIYSYI
ncbi:hypothetical protein WA026_012133 [Henosepilachna vigintioctopunctata]|uniref:AB hydrolase-1 domain-containing protein n=1 Tax=Henosepilachna vigintioctopunctata TaxID=420089 RepID=A0AAW1VF89_9CUCU